MPFQLFKRSNSAPGRLKGPAKEEKEERPKLTPSRSMPNRAMLVGKSSRGPSLPFQSRHRRLLQEGATLEIGPIYARDLRDPPLPPPKRSFLPFLDQKKRKQEAYEAATAMLRPVYLRFSIVDEAPWVSSMAVNNGLHGAGSGGGGHGSSGDTTEDDDDDEEEEDDEEEGGSERGFGGKGAPLEPPRRKRDHCLARVSTRPVRRDGKDGCQWRRAASASGRPGNTSGPRRDSDPGGGLLEIEVTDDMAREAGRSALSGGRLSLVVEAFRRDGTASGLSVAPKGKKPLKVAKGEVKPKKATEDVLLATGRVDLAEHLLRCRRPPRPLSNNNGEGNSNSNSKETPAEVLAVPLLLLGQAPIRKGPGKVKPWRQVQGQEGARAQPAGPIFARVGFSLAYRPPARPSLSHFSSSYITDLESVVENPVEEEEDDDDDSSSDGETDGEQEEGGRRDGDGGGGGVGVAAALAAEATTPTPSPGSSSSSSSSKARHVEAKGEATTPLAAGAASATGNPTPPVRLPPSSPPPAGTAAAASARRAQLLRVTAMLDDLEALPQSLAQVRASTAGGGGGGAKDDGAAATATAPATTNPPAE